MHFVWSRTFTQRRGRSSPPRRSRRSLGSEGTTSLRTLARNPARASPRRRELAVDLVQELQVEVEQPAQEGRGQHEVPAPVRQRLRTPLALRDSLDEVGDVVAQRRDALARDGLADEIGDQQADEELAL